jgi:hypothetical protein
METAPGLRLPAGYHQIVRRHLHIPRGKNTLSTENIKESDKITSYFLFVFNSQTACILPKGYLSLHQYKLPGEGLRSHNPTRKLFSVVEKLTGRGCVWRLLFNDVLI